MTLARFALALAALAAGASAVASQPAPAPPAAAPAPPSPPSFRQDVAWAPDGQAIAPPTEARGEVTTPASDLLSDRPARTGDKQRITLERATFAGGH